MDIYSRREEKHVSNFPLFGLYVISYGLYHKLSSIACTLVVEMETISRITTVSLIHDQSVS
jgi:hypothetical protein